MRGLRIVSGDVLEPMPEPPLFLDQGLSDVFQLLGIGGLRAIGKHRESSRRAFRLCKSKTRWKLLLYDPRIGLLQIIDLFPDDGRAKSRQQSKRNREQSELVDEFEMSEEAAHGFMNQ